MVQVYVSGTIIYTTYTTQSGRPHLQRGLPKQSSVDDPDCKKGFLLFRLYRSDDCYLGLQKAMLKRFLMIVIYKMLNRYLS